MLSLSIGKYKKFYISFYKDSSNGHKDNIKKKYRPVLLLNRNVNAHNNIANQTQQHIRGVTFHKVGFVSENYR